MTLPAQEIDRRAMKTCPNCGLRYQETLSHGMVDCVAEFRYRIEHLQQELGSARSRATIAEETLHEIAGAINGWKGE